MWSLNRNIGVTNSHSLSSRNKSPRITRQMFVLLVLVGGAHCFLRDNDPEGEHAVGGCEEVELVCPEEQQIVVSYAHFIKDRSLTSDCRKIEGETIGLPGEEKEIWETVVAQCSGLKGTTCVFNLDMSLPESRSWGRGRMEVRYSCEANISSYCGGSVQVESPGFVSSPAYPKYYLGGRDCVWTLGVKPGQQLKLTVMDLSLRGVQTPECQDSVRISDAGNTLVDLCGELDKPKELFSESGTVEVRMRSEASRQQLYPHRGLLINFSPRGCPDPKAPADGIIAGRNKTHAEMVCHPGNVFMSTLSSTITASCRNNLWVPPVEHCVSVNFLMQYGNNSIINSLTSSHVPVYQRFRSSAQSMEVVGVAVVGFLLVVSLALAGLLYIRRASNRNNTNKTNLSQIDGSSLGGSNSDLNFIEDEYYKERY